MEKCYDVDCIGNVISLRRNRIMRGSHDKDGYLYVTFSINKNVKLMKVHRLVAQKYIPNPNNLPIVNHKNGIKDDNRVENLEWCTGLYNERHARSTGLKKMSGADNPRVKLTEKQVAEIRELRGKLTIIEIGNLYGIHNSHVSAIHNNKTWKR